MKAKKINHFYPLWVWMTTLGTLPIVSLCSIFFESHPNFHSFFEALPDIIFYSIGFSLPVFILYTLSFFLLLRTRLKEIPAKLVLLFIALSGLLITLSWVSFLHPFLVLCYGIPLVVAGLAFRIRSRKNMPIKQFDFFTVNRDINPLIPRGSRGTILEVWEGGVFEVEFLDGQGQNILYDGKKSFTITADDIGIYGDPHPSNY